MTRAAVCGASFAAAVAILGLEPVEDSPDIVLLDLADAHAVARAAAIPAEVPRVVVAAPEQEALLRAAGSAATAVARSADAAAIGPLIASALPAAAPGRARLVVVTGVAGGIGRTLLVVNLAARLAERLTPVVIDATGSGAAGWWLGVTPGSWADLEGLVDELTSEHLGIVAAERERLRVIGGASHTPSLGLLVATARATEGLGDVVLVDAPDLFDDRARAVLPLADRTIVLCGADPISHAALEAAGPPSGAWSIGSRGPAEAFAGRDVLRVLPDDPRAVRAAADGPEMVGGALGRAYDELADLVAIDAS